MAWFGSRAKKAAVGGEQETAAQTLQRQDCPHAPHGGSCGPVHAGECLFHHPGTLCSAVRPVCPACRQAALGVHVSSILSRLRHEGQPLNLGCGKCGELSFYYDPELFCAKCEWLVPDVNERLASRYERRHSATEAREYTYGLQYLARVGTGEPAWKLATNIDDQVIVGLLRVAPSVSENDFTTTTCPRFLRDLLSRLGAQPDAMYRLVVWKGDLPTEQLDDNLAFAVIQHS